MTRLDSSIRSGALRHREVTMLSPHPVIDTLRKSGMVWLGIFVMGIGYGVVVVEAGLPWWFAPLSSVLAFAGSAQFIVVGLAAISTPLLAVAVTVLMVNFRFVFYLLTFPLEAVRSRGLKALTVFTVSDESWAMTTSLPRREQTAARILTMQLGNYLAWVIASLGGAVIGATILGGLQGLDFVFIALFICLALDTYHCRRDTTMLLIAVGCLALALPFGSQSLLFLSMFFLAISIAVRHVLTHRRQHV